VDRSVFPQINDILHVYPLVKLSCDSTPFSQSEINNPRNVHFKHLMPSDLAKHLNSHKWKVNYAPIGEIQKPNLHFGTISENGTSWESEEISLSGMRYSPA
jgi:hypothetical protein